MTAPHLCLIDVSGFVFRAYYALPPLTRASDGMPVGAISGFCNMMRRLPSVLRDPFTHVGAVFDTKEGSFRKDIAPFYKSNRTSPPEDLILQFPHMRPAARAFGLLSLEVPQFEADDVIATYAVAAEQAGYRVTIVSADKDLLQLITPHIRVYDPVKNAFRTAEDACKQFGVEPHLIADVQALAGDSSDGIKGVPSIGLKTAAALIQKAGSLDALLAHPQQAGTPRVQQLIKDHADDARLAYQLVWLRRDVPMPYGLDDLRYHAPAWPPLQQFLEEMGLKTLLKSMSPAHMVPASFDEAVSPTPLGTPQPDVVVQQRPIAEVIQSATQYGCCALYAYADGCLALATPNGIGAMVSLADALTHQTVWQNPAIVKITMHGKHLMRFLPLQAVHDTHVLEYAITGAPHQHVPTAAPIASEALAAAYALLARHTGNYAHAAQQQALALYEYVDRPLLLAVCAMEKVGIHVCAMAAAQVSAQFTHRLQALDAQIFEMVGYEFLLSSPKQLSDVLFNKLGIAVPSGVKQNASGYYPTGSEVLELIEHEIVPLILERRHLHKLQTTYADAIPQHINAKTGRVHGQFAICGTATGRLASSEPNLQNIPIRTAEGQLIRAMFTAPEGKVLIAADYSQIELRLLAHMADVAPLKEAFAADIDIHTLVASEVFGVALSEVTSELRRRAKAVNFGIIYGLSAHGLSKQLHITHSAAKQYIDAYFNRFPQIKTYMHDIITTAREQGYVQTLFGRRILLPIINDKLPARRAAGERAAINAPIQGTGADIMRRAAAKMYTALLQHELQTQVVLQVHDEILCEAPIAEKQAVCKLMQQVLPHAAAPLCVISVPLSVDVKWGGARDAMGCS